MVTVLSFLPPWKGDWRGTKITKNMPHLLRTETTPLLQSVLTVAFHVCKHLAGRTKEPVSGFSNTSCLGSPLITLRSYNVCHVEGHQATQNKQTITRGWFQGSGADLEGSGELPLPRPSPSHTETSGAPIQGPAACQRQGDPGASSRRQKRKIFQVYPPRRCWDHKNKNHNNNIDKHLLIT